MFVVGQCFYRLEMAKGTTVMTIIPDEGIEKVMEYVREFAPTVLMHIGIPKGDTRDAVNTLPRIEGDEKNADIYQYCADNKVMLVGLDGWVKIGQEVKGYETLLESMMTSKITTYLRFYKYDRILVVLPKSMLKAGSLVFDSHHRSPDITFVTEL